MLFQTILQRARSLLLVASSNISRLNLLPEHRTHSTLFYLELMLYMNHFLTYLLTHLCCCLLLQAFMEEPCFDRLRTRKQLGYYVDSSIRLTQGILAYSVTVNSHSSKFRWFNDVCTDRQYRTELNWTELNWTEWNWNVSARFSAFQCHCIDRTVQVPWAFFHCCWTFDMEHVTRQHQNCFICGVF